MGGFSADMLADPAVRAVIEETYNRLNNAVNSAIRTETPPELTAALQNNAFIFSGFKTYHSLSEVGLALTDDQGNVKPFDVFRRDVEAIDKRYNTNYLYAEYNHAAHTSQMVVKWNDFLRDGDKYNLQYRTAGDERVREAHAALNGITLPPSDDFWKYYLPPNGWNCRCQVVQVLRDDYPISESEAARAAGDACTEEAKARIFRYNAGHEMSIFPKKHPYLPKNCDGCKQQGSLNLAWGKGRPECVCCKHIFLQMTIEARRVARKQLKAERLEPLKINDPDGNISTGRLYLGRGDRDNIISHCMNPHEVVIARTIERYIPKMRHVRDEELQNKPNTAKKQARGVKRYAVYHFEAEIIEGGKRVTKLVELKCEVIKHEYRQTEEHPYVLKILQ